MTTVSKADQALNTYNTHVTAGLEGKALKAACVSSFVADLGMSDKGASTYFYNAKKKASGGVVKSYYKGKDSEDTSSDEPCGRKIYSIVNSVDDKVESTESHHDFKTANRLAKGRLVVVGLPELESNVNKLKPATK